MPPMVEGLKRGGGYTYDSSDKSLQKPPGATGCELVDRELLPATGHFVDQEAVGLMDLKI